jgi:hypothetical protein
VDCSTHPLTFCGDANAGSYWNQPDHGAYLGVWLDRFGFVHLDGAAQMAGPPQLWLLSVFYLPPSARPNAARTFLATDDNGDPHTVTIDPDGAVIAVIPQGDILSLSGITFHP